MAEESVGGVWIKEGKKGKYLSISIGGKDDQKDYFVAFKNDLKKPGEKTPDYRIFKSKMHGDDGDIQF